MRHLPGLLLGIGALVLGGCSILPIGAEAGPPDGDLIESYLSQNLLQPVHDGQVFCAVEDYGHTTDGDAGRAWIWAFCAEYYVGGGVLTIGAGVSEPLMLYLYRQGGRWLVTGHATPSSGEGWAQDVREMFPAEVVERMCLGDTACHNERAARLRAEAERKAQEALALPVAPAGNG